MSRVKTGVTRKNRHRNVLKATKGYWGTKNRLYKRAKEAFIHAGEHAFFGRKLRKRDMRKLWIIRLSAALKEYNLNYSVFINKLQKSKIKLNRKMLSEIAIKDSATFSAIIDKLK